MLHFSFKAERNSNTGNMKLISIGGITAEPGHWVISVGRGVESMSIDEYIPSDGVTVLFQLLHFSDPDHGRLLKT